MSTVKVCDRCGKQGGRIIQVYIPCDFTLLSSHKHDLCYDCMWEFTSKYQRIVDDFWRSKQSEPKPV